MTGILPPFVAAVLAAMLIGLTGSAQPAPPGASPHRGPGAGHASCCAAPVAAAGDEHHGLDDRLDGHLRAARTGGDVQLLAVPVRGDVRLLAGPRIDWLVGDGGFTGASTTGASTTGTSTTGASTTGASTTGTNGSTGSTAGTTGSTTTTSGTTGMSSTTGASTTGTNGTTGIGIDDPDPDPEPEDLDEDPSQDYIEAISVPKNANETPAKIAGLEADDIAPAGVSKLFKLRVHYGERDGWSLDVPTPPAHTFDWSFLSPSTGDLVMSNGSSADDVPSPTVQVISANIYRVECKVSMKKTVAGVEKKGVLTIRHKGNFAAIGGALKLSIVRSRRYPKPTWDHLLGNPDLAFYLQYLGAGPQDPQAAKIVIPDQPSTTVISATYPHQLVADPQRPGIRVASGEFDTTPVTATFKLTYTDDDNQELTNEVSDITTSVKDPVRSGNARLVNTFTARKPLELRWVGGETAQPQFDPNPTYTDLDDRCGRKDQFYLVDTLGEAMPGVYVQERFTPTNPDIQVNRNLNGWYTLLANPGYLNDYDWLGYWDTSPWGVLEYTHTFYAGTEVTAPGAPGVDVGTYKIKFTSDNGQQGTAKQDKQS